MNFVGLCWTSSYFFARYKPTDVCNRRFAPLLQERKHNWKKKSTFSLHYIYDTEDGSGVGERPVNYHNALCRWTLSVTGTTETVKCFEQELTGDTSKELSIVRFEALSSGSLFPDVSKELSIFKLMFYFQNMKKKAIKLIEISANRNPPTDLRIPEDLDAYLIN